LARTLAQQYEFIRPEIWSTETAKIMLLLTKKKDEDEIKTPGKFAHLSMTPVTFLRVTINLQRRVS
jgi:hypothetical protein